MWIVLSILFGVPLFFMTYQDDVYRWMTFDTRTQAEAWTTVTWRELRTGTCMTEPRTVVTTYPGLRWEGRVTCTTRQQFWYAVLAALIPAGLMAAFGFTVRWVYRGFRPSPR